jgi:hypothetical protein
MLNKAIIRRVAFAGVAALTMSAALVGTTESASAWWHGGWGWHGGGWHGGGWGWHGGWGGYHHAWGYGWGWRPGYYGWGVCPPGTHLGYYGHHCWPNV